MSLDMFPDAAVDFIIAENEKDLKALQRLRLARRNWTKRDRELDRAERRLMKANGKLYRAMDDVEARGLDISDPRSFDAD